MGQAASARAFNVVPFRRVNQLFSRSHWNQQHQQQQQQQQQQSLLGRRMHWGTTADYNLQHWSNLHAWSTLLSYNVTRVYRTSIITAGNDYFCDNNNNYNNKLCAWRHNMPPPPASWQYLHTYSPGGTCSGMLAI